MKKIEETLWKDYEDAKALVKELKYTEDTEKYRIAVEDCDKIRNELIKMEQMKNEKNDRNKILKSDFMKEIFKNGLSIITFGVSTGVSIYTIYRTFDFDKVSTVTSTLGRGTLNGAIPKLPKKI